MRGVMQMRANLRASIRVRCRCLSGTITAALRGYNIAASTRAALRMPAAACDGACDTEMTGQGKGAIIPIPGCKTLNQLINNKVDKRCIDALLCGTGAQ
jgi:hypothetical protein